MKDDQQILKNTFEETAAPDKAFVNRLEKDMLSEFQGNKPHNNFISLLFMNISSNALKFGVLSCGVLLFTAMAGGGMYYTYNTFLKPKTIANQDEILAQIAKQNPSKDSGAYEMAKNSNANASGSATATDQKVSALIAPMENRDYNYRKMTTQYSLGPDFNKCKIMLPYQGEVTSDESTQYFADKNEWFASNSKYILYKDGDIYDYNLNVKDEQWSYKGGSYAVHTTNNSRMVPMMTIRGGAAEGSASGTDDAVLLKESTIAAPVKDDKGSIVSRFGEGAKIVDTVTVDGRKMYKIQWSYNIGCSEITSKEGTVSLSNSDKGVFEALADASTYEIIQESLYLDKAKESNRVYTRKSTDIKKTVSLNDVKDEFTFNFPVTIKTYNAQAYDYSKEYKNALVNYLKSNNLDVIYASNKDYTLQSASSSYVTIIPDAQKHLIDRAFYSSKSYGEDAYNQAKDMFKPYIDSTRVTPVLQLSYSKPSANEYVWFNISEYNKTISNSDLIKGLYIDELRFEKTGSTTLLLKGVEVNADIYTLNPIMEPSTKPELDKPNESQGSTGSIGTYKDYYVVFTFENRSYVVQTSSNNAKVAIAQFVKLMNLTSASSSDSNTLSKVLTTDNTKILPVDGGIRY